MKHLAASLVLAGTIVAGSLASAQETVSLPAAGTPIVASFYDGDPFAGGSLLENGAWGAVEVTLDDSAIGKRIGGIDGADYVVLQVGDVSLTFDIMGGSSKNSIHLVYDGENLNGAPTLADVVGEISAALKGDSQLTVTTDAEGVVTGVYTVSAESVPASALSEAAHVITLS